MKTLTLAGLTARLVGGDDGAGGGEGPLVVLLHGFGAPGDDLVSLAQVLGGPPGTRYLFPAAPIDLGPQYGGGRAWWPIHFEERLLRRMRGDFGERDVPEGLREARAKITQLLSEAQERLAPSRIVLGGFSQGAMLSTDVALRTELPLAGLMLLSGTQLAIDEWTPRMAARAGLPVFMSHGSEDEILPQPVSERLAAMLGEAGLELEWVGFRGGHGIPATVVQRAVAFLARVLG